jgi:hypothetical protein
MEVFPRLRERMREVKSVEEINEMQKGVEKRKKVKFEKREIRKIEEFKIKGGYEYIYVSKRAGYYRWIVEMYKEIKEMGIFKIDEGIMSERVREIVRERYMVIHIRYGDKLRLACGGENMWLLYTPEYYKEIIERCKGKIKIYIITDDVKIVKRYVMGGEEKEGVEILEEPWWGAYYCITRARYVTMSISTFSITGVMINEEMKSGYVITRPKDKGLKNNKRIEEEDMIDKMNITKINNRKYILNYNKELMERMIEYSGIK